MKPATAPSFSVARAVFASFATVASCERSEPTFVTSCVTIKWFSVSTATCTLYPTTPEPRPLVAIERESGSVSEICWSGEASICLSIAARRCISLSSFASFSFSGVVFGASVSEGSCRSAVSSWLRYRATLSSSCARRRSTLARVKFRSRLFTALNLLPSMATLAVASRPISRQSSTKRAHTLRIAGPLSLRKSAIVLWSGTRPQRSHIASKLRPASRSSPPARLHPIEVAVNVKLQENRGMIGRPPGHLRLHPCEPQLGKIERLHKRIDHTNRIILVDPVIEAFGQQRRLTARHPFNKPPHPLPRKSTFAGKENHSGPIIRSTVFLHSQGQNRPLKAGGANVRSRCKQSF